LKQLRSKVLNFEYDLNEKNERILSLESELKKIKQGSTRGDGIDIPERVSQEELKSLELSLSRKAEEISHLTADISRLQLEKQEAEASGQITLLSSSLSVSLCLCLSLSVSLSLCLSLSVSLSVSLSLSLSLSLMCSRLSPCR
jgi:predicted RNase H-like nuclease (RuvC/YqgF family)